MIISEPGPGPRDRAIEKTWWAGLLAATIIHCAFQIAWFWRFRVHNITMDGIDYIGLARHLVDGNFAASLHGYWSPLTSWIIAAAMPFSRNLTLLGRLVTIGSFLLCLPLLYVLTLRLWRSRTAAALAVFWFSAARGLVGLAVGSILADFVLTACVLSYFILLLGALRANNPRNWATLGAAHALAFLAKAIAMPWLAISTALALIAQNARAPRRFVAMALLAFLVPGLVWLGWGTALRARYGVFTTGYQLRANLMINWNRSLSHYARGNDQAFWDNPSLYDDYAVGELWPAVRSFNLHNPALLKMIVDTEIQNVPRAAKEFLVLLTPAGAIAFPIMVALLIRRRTEFKDEVTFAVIAVLSACSMVVAYCMLVFDGRYIIPITPVLIAISCPLLLPSSFVPCAPRLSPALQRAGLGLLAVSLVFFASYWASPLRTVDRDFEVSCYQAADALRQAASRGALVSIGHGPYPEHGIGFEVGPYVAYLSGWHLVGGNAGLPDAPDADALAAKVLATKADAVAVWGSPANPAYVRVTSVIRSAPGVFSASGFSDPYRGEVGTLILFASKNQGSRSGSGVGGNLVATGN